jgi:hypothetical protein
MRNLKFPMLFTGFALAAIFAMQSTGMALQEPANPPTPQPSTHDPAAQSNTMSEGAETRVFLQPRCSTKCPCAGIFASNSYVGIFAFDL